MLLNPKEPRSGNTLSTYLFCRNPGETVQNDHLSIFGLKRLKIENTRSVLIDSKDIIMIVGCQGPEKPKRADKPPERL